MTSFADYIGGAPEMEREDDDKLEDLKKEADHDKGHDRGDEKDAPDKPDAPNKAPAPQQFGPAMPDNSKWSASTVPVKLPGGAPQSFTPISGLQDGAGDDSSGAMPSGPPAGAQAPQQPPSAAPGSHLAEMRKRFPIAPPVDELTAAQNDDKKQRAWANADAMAGDAGNVARGEMSHAADIDNRTREDASGAKDILQRREAAAKAVQDKAQADLHDASSGPGKIATTLGRARGYIGPKEVMSAADYQAVAGQIKDGASIDEAKARLAAEKERQDAEIKSREGEGAKNRANAIQLERERMAAERQAKLDEINAKGSAKPALKPLDPQDLLKNAGADTGAQAALRQWDAFDKVAEFGQLGPDSSKYDKNRKSDSMTMAIGRNPNAREIINQNGVNADEYTPSPSDTKGSGAYKIGQQMEAIRGGLSSRIKTLGGAGIDVSPLKEELSRVAKAHGDFLERAGEHLGKVSVKSPDGRVIQVPAKAAAQFARDPRFEVMGG